MQSERVIVVGRDMMNQGALLTIFDGRDDKFVSNPIIYKNDQYDEVNLVTEVYRINDICMVTTQKHLLKNLVYGTNRGSLCVINLPEKRTNNLQNERFLRSDLIH